MARNDEGKTRIPYIANLSLTGKNADELSYSFSERALPAHGHTAIFGLFHVQGAQEIYHVFIKETVKCYLDFFHRSPRDPSDVAPEKKVDIDGFLFEHSLQYVSECVSNALADYQEQSNKSVGLDTRKIHFIIGALIGQTLYLTVYGKYVRALLLYPTQSNNPSLPYSLIDIAEQQSADDQGERFFASVISGSVSIPRSKLVICNSTFLDYVSTDQLKHALTNQASNAIGHYFSRHLSRASARSDFAALFIDPWFDTGLSVEHDRLSKDMRTSHISIESMLDRQKGTSTVLMPGFVRSTGAVLVSLFALVAGLLRSLSKKTTILSFVRLVHVPKFKLEPEHIRRSLIRAVRASRNWIVASYRYARHQMLPFANLLYKRTFALLKVRVWDAFHALQPNSKALMIVSLLFLVLFLQSLIAIQSKRQRDSDISSQGEKLQQVEQKLNLAEASIIYESDDKTKALLLEALTILDMIRSSPDSETRIDSLRTKHQFLQKKLSRTIDIAEPALVADLTNQIPSIESLRFVGETDPLVVANRDGLYLVDRKSGNAKQVNTQSKLPTVPCATSKNADTVYVCGAKNRIFSYRLPTDTLSAVPYTDSGQSFGTIAVFNKRLYVLDTSRGILTRHNQSGDGFGSGASWIKDGSTVIDAKDFAIDGNVYVLMPDSSISVYNAGRRVASVDVPSLQPPIQSLSRIKASNATNTLYAVDPGNRRIILVDSRTNSFVLAITSRLFEQAIQDILVTKDDLYVLAGGKIMRISLDQIKL